MSNTTQRFSLRAALLSGCAVALLGNAGVAFAQAEPQERVEEIVVTGTRLRAVAPVGSQMIDVGREQIAVSSALNVQQLTQELPQVLNLGVSDSSRGQSGGSANTSFSNAINIRGIGPYSTLTLIDGHRSVPQGTTGYAVDPSVIPSIALQRLEVVADGASAIYGSDAIAGVANLILRRNVEGAEVLVRYGDGDNYLERQYSGIWGHRWSSGQFTIAGESTYRDNVNGRDRDFFRSDLRPQGGGDYSVNLCNPGNIVVGGVSYAIPAGGVTAANRGALTPGTSNRCDPLKAVDLLPQQKRMGAMFTFDQDLTDWLTFKADGFYSKRDFLRNGNFTATTLSVPSTNAFFVAPPGLTPASESVQYSFEGVYPQLQTTGGSKAEQIHAQLEGRVGRDWRVTGDITVGRNEEATNTNIAPVAARLAAALASSNPQTALNVFGGPTNPAVIQDILSGVAYTRGVTKFEDYQLQADGPLFSLPGGVVRAAIGYEGQRLSINPSNIDGTILAPRTRTKVRTRAVDSGFVEVLVPIIGDGNSMPLVRSLDINLAGRYDSYDDVGDTWNPKIGINWRPHDDLTIRASYGTSFRAPALTQLYGTGGGTLALFVQNYQDPTCNCVRQGVASSGENLGLVPEEARTLSLGFDWRPKSISGFNVSVNLFDIVYEKQITALISDLSLLGRESQYAGTGVITRNPTAAFIADLVARSEATNGIIPNPVTLYINGGGLNTGSTEASGLDYQIGYNFSPGAGRLALNWSGSYFFRFKQSFGPSGPLLDILNTIYNPMRFKSRASARWVMGPVDAYAAITYVNGYDNNVVTPAQRVKPYTPVDLRLGYTFENGFRGKPVKLSLDVRNAFDIKPPFVNIAQSNNGGGGFDPTIADPTGRVIALVLEAKF